MVERLSGGCLCGKVRFSAAPAARDMGVCHCSMCQSSTGSPRLTGSAGPVKFIGGEQMSRYKSSDWAERCFCPKCGSSLSYYLTEAERCVMTVGKFDDAEAFNIVGEICI